MKFSQKYNFKILSNAPLRRLSFSSEEGVPNKLGGHKFVERKIGGHEMFDNQIVGSHKIIIIIIFIQIVCLFCSKRLISIQF